jgi:hypothetical protein
MWKISRLLLYFTAHTEVIVLSVAVILIIILSVVVPYWGSHLKMRFVTLSGGQRLEKFTGHD